LGSKEEKHNRIKEKKKGGRAVAIKQKLFPVEF